jgi:hypothetical protein
VNNYKLTVTHSVITFLSIYVLCTVTGMALVSDTVMGNICMCPFTMRLISWHVDPLLSNDRETNY